MTERKKGKEIFVKYVGTKLEDLKNQSVTFKNLAYRSKIKATTLRARWNTSGSPSEVDDKLLSESENNNQGKKILLKYVGSIIEDIIGESVSFQTLSFHTKIKAHTIRIRWNKIGRPDEIGDEILFGEQYSMRRKREEVEREILSRIPSPTEYELKYL